MGFAAKNALVLAVVPNLRLVYWLDLMNNQASGQNYILPHLSNSILSGYPMAFFSADKLKRRKIEVEHSSATSKSPEVEQRLNRIQENYRQLDSILAELESKIQGDERLKAIDDANVDFEGTFGIKKKRKWRTPKPKSKSRRRKSEGPNKPR